MMNDNLERIQFTIDYMEQNLKVELPVQELSEMIGYSHFHYCDLFQKVVGMSVKQYLVSRRLKHAIYDIAQGCKKQDIALAYGFDTYAGFYKAFVREYGMSPSDYLKSYKPAKPYGVDLKQEGKIMLTQKTVRKLLAHWNMEACSISNVYLEGGEQISENDFYVGEKYVLKVSTFPGGLKRHVEISCALQETDLKVSIPIPDKDGEIIVEDQNVYCILCQRVHGNRVNSKTLFKTCDVLTAYQFGKMIGRLHQALAKLDASLCKENNLYQSVREWAFPKVQKKMAFPRELAAEYEERLGTVYDELPKQVIHRNMNLNYVYQEDGELVGVTDFELSEYSIRLFDVCYAATGILSENFANEDDCIEKWIPLYQSILKGYDEVLHLTEQEKQVLPYVVFSIQFTCVAYFADMEKYTDLAKINEQMLEKLIKYKERLFID